MPVAAALKRVTSWSYSRYSMYKRCPAAFRYKHLLKLPEESGPALARGAAIGKEAELYVKGVSGARVPESLKEFAHEFRALRAARRKAPASVPVEETWAFRADWTKTRFDDWDGCRVRVKVDVARLEGSDLKITDIKTGKYKPDGDGATEYAEQLDLYALGGLLWFAMVPELKVTTRLLYLDAGVEHVTADTTGAPVVYTRDDVPRLKKEWEARVKPMLSDTTFAPRPNWACKYCSYQKARGGPCRY